MPKALKKRKKSLIITYDPKKGHDLSLKNINLGTPNLSEAQALVSKQNDISLCFEETGKFLRKRWQSDALLLTRGEKGMSLFEKGKKSIHIPTAAREIYDVSGAGDTVIATATAALAAGASIHESAILSNYAAGIVVGKLGTQTTTRKEIIDKIKQEA